MKKAITLSKTDHSHWTALGVIAAHPCECDMLLYIALCYYI